MDKTKQQRLSARGWKIGGPEELLGLSAEDMAYIDIKAALSRGLRAYREEQQITQAEAAKRVHSSQSRVAKMEAGDPSVSIDLLIKTLLALGAPRKHVAALLKS